MQGKWLSITLLVLAEVLVMALWFSASATLPALRAEYGLDDTQSSLISSSVNLGFVAGTLISAFLGLADRLNPKLFFIASALVAAAANAAILLVDPTSAALPALRFIVGACMAGVYPVGMKMASSWALRDMGLLVGLLVAALVLGSGSPHLIDALGGLDWRFTIAASSLAAVAGGVIILTVRIGPNWAPSPKFRPALALEAWRNRPLLFANLGYFGHMWELYAMWAWIGVFLSASFAISPGGEDSQLLARIATFAIVAAGAVGSLAGGIFADRMGRTTLTMLAMAISGSCALVAGLFFGASPWLLMPLCLVWGLTIVADSAQFSASVIELADPGLIGTMLTVQTCIGFLLTLFTIHMVPVWVETLGWTYAFAPLAIGPFLGVLAMGALRRRPESLRLAQGNR